MKPGLSYFFPLILFLTAFSLPGDDCDVYYPLRQGDYRAYTSYDSNGKVTGSSVQKVLSTTAIDGGVEVLMGVETRDAGADTALSGTFTVRCRNGEYSMGMDHFLDPSALATYKGMEIVIGSDRLDLPVNPRAGQKLNGGTVSAKVMSNGFAVVTISVQVTNRQVSGMEDISTPAGTFSCAKITYDVESKIGFITSNSKAAEWYSKKNGLVKSAVYDKKGKVQSYSLLTAVNK